MIDATDADTTPDDDADAPGAPNVIEAGAPVATDEADAAPVGAESDTAASAPTATPAPDADALPVGAPRLTDATDPVASAEPCAVAVGAESDAAASVPVAMDDADADAVGAERVIDGNEPVADPLLLPPPPSGMKSMRIGTAYGRKICQGFAERLNPSASDSARL